MNSYYHSKNTANKFGGKVEDYSAIHEFIDSSKSAHPDVRHRCVLHSAFGIFIVQKVFGQTIKNSDGRSVPVRLVAENHIMEDLGFIPSLERWIGEMPVCDWMIGKKNIPAKPKFKITKD